MSPTPLILLLLVCAASARAGTLSLSVDGSAQYALKHNPALTAARLRIDEASGRLHQSGRLPNPELGLDLTRHTAGPEHSAEISFTQRFPITARLRHERTVSRAELAAAEAEFRDAQRKLAAEVRSAAVKLLTISGQRSLRTQQLDNSRNLSEFLIKRVATGEASAVDASQVDLESRQIQLEKLMLNADEAVLLGELRPLLGVSANEHINITGSLPNPAPPPPPARSLLRPDIIAAQHRATAANAFVREQQARRWEDISVGASFSRDRTVDEPMGTETERIVGFRFSLPLPLWNDNSGRILEARAAASRAAAELDATRLSASAQSTAARSAMNSYAALLAELDSKVLPAASQIEDQLRNSYTSGQTPLTEVLRARTRRLDLQRQRLDALRDYHLARIRHDAAIGNTVAPTAHKQ